MPIPKNRLTTSPAARRARRTFRHRLRPQWQDSVATARMRRRAFRGNAPDYLIIGVNKAGTTALFESISAQPGFGRPLQKEIHYFDAFPDKPAAWYFAHFWGPSDLVWGEATPEYLHQPDAPARARALLPDAKLIVLLRDPVRRAISHYYNAVDHDTETRPLASAIADEVAALERGEVPTRRNELSNAYVWRSRYHDALERWIAEFGRERLLVLVAEERDSSLERALEFLGMGAPVVQPSTAQSNARAYPEPSPDVIAAIADAVRPDAERLPALLGWDSLPGAW